MWIIDVVIFAVICGGLIFWYHFLKRNVTSTHRVVLTQKKNRPWRIEKVNKFFGCIFRKEKVDAVDTFEAAVRSASSHEEMLKENQDAKTVCRVYEMGDLNRVLLEAPIPEEDKKKDPRQ